MDGRCPLDCVKPVHCFSEARGAFLVSEFEVYPDGLIFFEAVAV